MAHIAKSRRHRSEFVSSGAGFVGICAGAFVATDQGFGGARETHAILGASTSWNPGLGTAHVEITAAAVDVFGDDVFHAGEEVDMCTRLAKRGRGGERERVPVFLHVRLN